MITEEPKRYRQESFIVHGRTNILNFGVPVPACGTVCCVAGWVDVLVLGDPGRVNQMNASPLESIADLAQKTLGINRLQANRLFGGGAIELMTPWNQKGPESGTPEYAALGVKHIRAFQKKHAAQLKRKIVKPVAKRAAARG